MSKKSNNTDAEIKYVRALIEMESTDIWRTGYETFEKFLAAHDLMSPRHYARARRRLDESSLPDAPVRTRAKRVVEALRRHVGELNREIEAKDRVIAACREKYGELPARGATKPTSEEDRHRLFRAKYDNPTKWEWT